MFFLKNSEGGQVNFRRGITRICQFIVTANGNFKKLGGLFMSNVKFFIEGATEVGLTHMATPSYLAYNKRETENIVN